MRATIVNLNPLELDVIGEELTLGADDVDFSRAVVQAQAAGDVQVGDELALIEAEDGEWTAVAVVTDRA